MTASSSRSEFARRAIVIALPVVFFSFIPAPVTAQIDTGSIAGIVTDETGAALPGVTVTITNLSTRQGRTVVTNELGRYQVTALQPSKYSVRAEISGFATVARPEVTVNVGSAVDVNIAMKVATIEETVTVTGEAPLIESTKTDFSNVITSEQLETLPSKARQYLDFTLLLPATVENTSTTAQGSGLNMGGSRAKEAALLVDGFYNMDEGFALPKQRHSQDAIQEFQVISFGGSAEYGRAIGGIVNAVTKSGGNAIGGSGYGYFRNKALNAQDPGEKKRGVPKSEFSREQWGGTIGGPIKRDKSFFFGAYERVTEDFPMDNGIRTEDAARIGLPPQDVGTIPRFYRLNFTMAKWDHNVNDNHRLQTSFAMSRWTEHNICCPQSFGARSRQWQLAATDWSGVIKWTRIAGEGRVLHEVKGSHFPRFYGVTGVNEGGPPLTQEGQINPRAQSNSSPPSVSISSVASFGGVTLNNKINTYPTQILYSTTFFTNKHTMKFGSDYMVAYYDYTLYSLLRGSYSFSNLDNFLRGNYTQYTQSFGDPHNPRWHQYVSGFAQDSWQPSNRMTMNFGVRYDLEIHPKHKASGQRFGKDYNNFGPRFALSYDLTGRGQTFVKLATGVYHDRLFQNLTTFFTTVKGYEQIVSATWTPTSPGAPVYPNVFAQRPSSLPRSVVNAWILPDDLKTPTSGQVVATLEQALTQNLAVSGSFVYTRSWDKEYGWDTNLAFDDATQRWVRPDPNYRAINQYRFGGKAEYYGGIFELTKRGGRFGYNANLTVARSYDTGNNYGVAPQDQRLGIDSEWGPTVDTPMVKGVVSGWYNLAPSIQVSGVVKARSGMAVDPTAANIDLNGDGRTGDRTPTFGRNSFRGSGTTSLDLRFTWMVPLGQNRKLHLYLEGFNVLDNENLRTFNSDYGPNPDSPKSRWLEPITYFPPREVQLGVRLAF